MAVFHGKLGKVDFGGVISSILGWTLNITGDIADSSIVAASAWWKSFTAGYIDTAATADANAMTESTLKVGTDAQLKLYVNATKYFDITNSVCIEQTETVNKDDVGKISYSFLGNDATGPVYT